MIYYVLAQSFNRQTGLPTAAPRVEEINTKTNELFKHCVNVLAVKKAYEGFWNELNHDSADVVFVQQVATNREELPVDRIIMAEALEIAGEFSAMYTGNGVRRGYKFPCHVVSGKDREPDAEKVTSYARKIVKEFTDGQRY